MASGVMRPNYSVRFQKGVVVQVERVASSLDKGSKSAKDCQWDCWDGGNAKVCRKDKVNSG